VVPIYGTCQCSVAIMFRYGAEAENPELLCNFNPLFPSAGTGTYRQTFNQE